MLERRFAVAAELYAKSNFLEAADEYHNVVTDVAATLADKLRAWNNMSACRAQLGDYRGALEAAQKSLGLDAGSSKALARAAAACEGLRHYREAISYLDKIDKSDPLHAKHTATIARLQQLLVGTDTSPCCHVDRSSCALPGRTPATSMAAVETATTRQHRFYYNKSLENAKAAMQSSNYVEAIRYYTKALNFFETLHRCTGASCANDKASKACAQEAESRDQGVTAREHAVLLCNRSSAYLRGGQSDAAAEDAMRAIEVDRSYARAFFRLGCARQAAKQHIDAVHAAKQCLELDPSHAEARDLLRCAEPLAEEQGKTMADKAREHAQRVAAMKEKHNDVVAGQAASNAFAARSRTTAYAATYVHCNYCNETGHTRDECPLRRRKRMR